MTKPGSPARRQRVTAILFRRKKGYVEMNNRSYLMRKVFYCIGVDSVDNKRTFAARN